MFADKFPNFRWRWRDCVKTLVYNSVLIYAFSDCCKIYREALIDTFTILPPSLHVAVITLISRQCFTPGRLGPGHPMGMLLLLGEGRWQLYTLLSIPSPNTQTPDTQHSAIDPRAAAAAACQAHADTRHAAADTTTPAFPSPPRQPGPRQTSGG